MPNNINGRGLTDREMLQLCLELEKSRCRSISQTILEAVHSDLRHIYQQCFELASSNQHELYKIMDEKGWYETQLASQNSIQQVQEYMKNNLHPDAHYEGK
ncbi:hypothetical protein GJU40_00955 [Bacillus lacus]|uniref:Spore coat protein n=1 Tax=Metabacillus lacus TaxID=1983721 RepID=A0A7X2IWH2_9BACI|nr:spore coat protein [Metabacillus lacus]MRX70737.1 hypothetical protein [Metabacillus lacus]